MNGEKTSALAEEFKITPREVLAVVEHFKMSDGVRADAVASLDARHRRRRGG